MSSILEGLDGVICHMDDILIHSETQEEHNKLVREVLKRLQDAGLTLNDKCDFSKRKIRFLGFGNTRGHTQDFRDHRLSSSHKHCRTATVYGYGQSARKVHTGLSQLYRAQAWYWGESQQRSFQTVKDLLISPKVLAPYDLNRPTIVAADASNYGIGAVLIQIQDNGTRRPVCYASRSLKDHEQRYTVIEKEALAATWACEKFEEYILGLHFTIETDHKPLVPLLSTTALSKMPPRIQRFRLKLMRYSPSVVHVPGKQQIVADALSCAPSGQPDDADIAFIAEVEAYANQAVNALLATQQRLQNIAEAQQADEECMQIIDYCKNE